MAAADNISCTPKPDGANRAPAAAAVAVAGTASPLLMTRAARILLSPSREQPAPVLEYAQYRFQLQTENGVHRLECHNMRKNTDTLAYEFGFQNELRLFAANALFHVFVDSQNLVYVIENDGEIVFENPLLYGTVVGLELSAHSHHLVLLTREADLRIIDLRTKALVFSQSIKSLCEVAK